MPEAPSLLLWNAFYLMLVLALAWFGHFLARERLLTKANKALLLNYLCILIWVIAYSLARRQIFPSEIGGWFIRLACLAGGALALAYNRYTALLHPKEKAMPGIYYAVRLINWLAVAGSILTVTPWFLPYKATLVRAPGYGLIFYYFIFLLIGVLYIYIAVLRWRTVEHARRMEVVVMTASLGVSWAVRCLLSLHTYITGENHPILNMLFLMWFCMFIWVGICSCSAVYNVRQVLRYIAYAVAMLLVMGLAYGAGYYGLTLLAEGSFVVCHLGGGAAALLAARKAGQHLRYALHLEIDASAVLRQLRMGLGSIDGLPKARQAIIEAYRDWSDDSALHIYVLRDGHYECLAPPQ
ncbi:MAG: hypothetical protein HZA31_00700, partial [Opitutae bacterium]|nr:hypothetical protein [Opitutae bacterium]